MKKIPFPPTYETALTVAKVEIQKAFYGEESCISTCELYTFLRNRFEDCTDGRFDAIYDGLIENGTLTEDDDEEWHLTPLNVESHIKCLVAGYSSLRYKTNQQKEERP